MLGLAAVELRLVLMLVLLVVVELLLLLLLGAAATVAATVTVTVADDRLVDVFTGQRLQLRPVIIIMLLVLVGLFQMCVHCEAGGGAGDVAILLGWCGRDAGHYCGLVCVRCSLIC